ncbi:hypothetical protein Tco_0257559 [Tanacetum coccineum]
MDTASLKIVLEFSGIRVKMRRRTSIHVPICICWIPKSHGIKRLRQKRFLTIVAGVNHEQLPDQKSLLLCAEGLWAGLLKSVEVLFCELHSTHQIKIQQHGKRPLIGADELKNIPIASST